MIRFKHLAPFLAGGILLLLGVVFFIVFVNRLPLYSNVRAVQSISNLNIVLPAQLPADTTITQHPMHDAKTGGVVTAIDIGGYRVVFSQQKNLVPT